MTKIGCKKHGWIHKRHILPVNYRTPEASYKLYSIGLLAENNTNFNTNLIHNPYVMQIILWIFIIKTIITLNTPKEYRIVFIIFGDFPYLMSNPSHINLIFISG